MKKLFIAFLISSTLIAPSAQAVSLDDLQAQINSLMQIMQGLLIQLQNQTPPTNSVTPTPPPVTFCTQDAKLCPDGSYVGRIAPACNFAACPTIPDTTPTLTAELSDSPDGKIVIFTASHGDSNSYPPSHSDGQDTRIDFDDGTETQWVHCANGFSGFAGSGKKCITPATYKHIYANPGTYTARLIRSGRYCRAPGCPITELARTTVKIPKKTSGFCTKEYMPVCGVTNLCPQGAYCLAPSIMKTYGNMCELKKAGASFSHKGKCETYTNNTAPVIDSFSGPTVLQINETGTWRIEAHSKENQQLTYKISWGDERVIPYGAPFRVLAEMDIAFTQETTFEHRYTRDGKYTIRITVQDEKGLRTNTSTTVHVKNSNNSICIIDGDMAYAEGQSVQCLPQANGTTGCIPDASYVCREGNWVIETHNQFYDQSYINYDTYDINGIITNFNNGNQNFIEILNQASSLLQQYLIK